jgi:signal peptidase I
LVQSELHPEDEGRESDRNPGEPHADAAPARIPEAVAESHVAPPAIDYAEALAEKEIAQTEAEIAEIEAATMSVAGEPPSWGAPETPSTAIVAPVAAGVAAGAAGAAATAGAAAAVTPAAVADSPRLTSPGIRLAQVKDELVAWVKTLVSAAVYAVLIVTFGFQVARVEGQSMAPTLEDQDRLIVNKLVYRIGEPRRGDIVMLYYPLNPEKSFVKRVIAEEGDTVRIVDGRVYVNDIPLKDDYVPSEFRSHDDWGPQVIPEGYYFVMGDHRNNSSDSRHWGMVPKKYIIGKVQLRWWPVPTARVF